MCVHEAIAIAGVKHMLGSLVEFLACDTINAKRGGLFLFFCSICLCTFAQCALTC